MGTSVAQIERHYSHVKNIQKAEKLSSGRLPGRDETVMKFLGKNEEVLKPVRDEISDEIDAISSDEGKRRRTG